MRDKDDSLPINPEVRRDKPGAPESISGDHRPALNEPQRNERHAALMRRRRGLRVTAGRKNRPRMMTARELMLPGLIESIMPVDETWVRRAEARQLTLTKPPGSLGRLEEIANRVAAMQETLEPNVSRRRIVVFAADHGVTCEGVSVYPSEVTSQMVANFRAGGAAINALAKVAGAELCVIDIGVAEASPSADTGDVAARRVETKFIKRRVRTGGTANIARGGAMTEDEMHAALVVGVEAAQSCARAGVQLIGLGEMGIGNTTAASAVTAALTGLAPAQVTGRGTGADDEIYARKVAVVARALAINQPQATDAFDVLRKVGGLEMAGLCGLVLGAAAARIAIIADGFIATAGATLAVRLNKAVADYLFAAHLSTEPGHAALLTLINQQPLLDLRMRLGEGTGAALAMNLIGAGVAALTEMATFESAKVSGRRADVRGDVFGGASSHGTSDDE